MKWTKQGRFLNIDHRSDLQVSYAGLPTVDILSDKVWRVYYTARDAKNMSRPFYVDVEAGNPHNIIQWHDEPIIDVGKLGSCDEMGVTPCTICNFGDRKFMYYVGWTVRNTISYHNSNFLAISEDGGDTWKKVEGPVISPTPWEPYCSASPFVLNDDGLLKMYYASFVGWKMFDNHPEPMYNIKYAESKDGLIWDRGPHTAVDFKHGHPDFSEGGVAKPSVVRDGNLYRIWYTYRGAADYRTNRDHSYRIGYGESLDGKTFVRMDDRAGIDISDSGWDDTMVTYPHVIRWKDKYYMFYNGNMFGKTGAGYATLDAAEIDR
jgi:hypothetical protein